LKKTQMLLESKIIILIVLWTFMQEKQKIISVFKSMINDHGSYSD
jgi:hypothetical protein